MLHFFFFFLYFSETSWPGVTKLPDFKAQFPRWEPQSLSTLLPVTLSAQGQDLFQVNEKRNATFIPYLSNKRTDST